MTSVQWRTDRSVAVWGVSPASAGRLVGSLAPLLPGRTVRSGLDHVLVESEVPEPGLLEQVERAIAGLATDEASGAGQEPTRLIPTYYDGPDLDEVARQVRLSPQALVRAHLATTWQVAMLGFAPGFGYLVPLDDPQLWSTVERLASPRTSVPAGSVAVAAGMSAVYPSVMPGGWRLIGRSTVMLFDPANAVDPTLLHPGDRVRFVEASP